MLLYLHRFSTSHVPSTLFGSWLRQPHGEMICEQKNHDIRFRAHFMQIFPRGFSPRSEAETGTTNNNLLASQLQGETLISQCQFYNGSWINSTVGILLSHRKRLVWQQRKSKIVSVSRFALVFMNNYQL